MKVADILFGVPPSTVGLRKKSSSGVISYAITLALRDYDEWLVLIQMVPLQLKWLLDIQIMPLQLEWLLDILMMPVLVRIAWKGIR